MINITKTTILTIARIIIIAINHDKKSVMFMSKKVVTLIYIQKMNNER